MKKKQGVWSRLSISERKLNITRAVWKVCMQKLHDEHLLEPRTTVVKAAEQVNAFLLGGNS